MAGIFGSLGAWCTGMDFLPDGVLSAGGVFDAVLNTPVISASWARFSGKGIQFTANTYVGRSFGTNLATHIGGFAYLMPSLPTGSTIHVVATWMDTTAGAVQESLGINSQGQLQFYQAGGLGVSTVLTSPIGPASASGIIVPGAYNFFEFKLTISASVGVLQLYVNGVQVITFSGNTRTTANSYINQLRVGSLAANILSQMDDIYLLDTTATSPLNTFLGNGRVQTDGPTGDSGTGGLNTWAHTTPQGTDWGNAANIPANSAQYNSDSNPGNRMSFVFPALATSKVLFLNTWISAEQDSAGIRTIEPVFRSNNTDQVGTVISLSGGTYVYSNQISTIDPNTGVGWSAGSVAAAGNCEIGVETAS